MKPGTSLCSLAVSSALAACASTVTPPPAHFEAYRVPDLEVLIQNGAEGDEWGGVTRWQGATYLTTIGGGDYRVWRLEPSTRTWHVQRRWAGGTNMFSVVECGLGILETPAGAEVLRLGAWGTPLLTSADGVPPHIADAWVFPRDLPPGTSTPRWCGIALKERGDADLDGTPDTWRLFAEEPGHPLAPWSPPGVALPVRDFLRIAPLEIAVQGADQRWSFMRLDAARAWLPLDVPLARAPTIVRRLIKDRVLELTTAAGTIDLLVRGAAGSWRSGDQALPRLPQRVARTRVWGKRLLGLMEHADADGDGTAWAWRWYTLTSDERWAPLDEVVGPLDPRADVMGLADDQALMVRDDRSRRVYVRAADGAWAPLATAVPAAPSLVLDIADFGAGRGLAVRGPPSADAAERGWRFFVADAHGAWRPLAEHVPAFATLEESALEVASGDVDHELRVKLTDDLWRAYLRDDEGRWQSVSDVLPGAPRDPSGVSMDWKVGRATLVGTNGRRFPCYRDDAGRWQELVLPIERPPRAGASPLFTRVAHVRTDAGGYADITAEPAPDAPTRWRLLRGAGGDWRPIADVLVGVPRIEDVKLAGGLVSVRAGEVGQANAWRHLLRERDGTWLPVGDLVAGAAPRVRDAYTFLGGRGLALADEGDSDGDGVFDEWDFWYRGDAGWTPLADAIPGLPASIALVFSVSDDDGLGVQELGDPDHDGVSGELTYLLATPAGWRPLSDVLPEAPRGVWQLALHARGAVVGVAADPVADPGAPPWTWVVRRADGTSAPLRQVLPGSPAAIIEARTLAQGRVLAVNDGTGTWTLYRATGTDAWARLDTGGRVVEVREAPGLLALARTDAAATTTWSVFVVSADAELAPLVLPDAPDRARDVMFDGAHLALALGPDVWRWYGRKDGQWRALGEAAGPSWPGFGWRRGAHELVTIDGATHTIDGVAWPGVPRPSLWIGRDAATLAGRDALAAPTLLPSEIEVFASGKAGATLVYTLAGRRHASAFRHGAVLLRRVRLAKGPSDHVTFIANSFDDGTTRLHRLDDPTRFITLFTDAAGGEAYYDDRGYFYTTTGRIADVMTFRNRDRVYAFSQLAAYLFRPDKLEERLGLPEGALFSQTPTDQATVARARVLAGDGALDVASLVPPQLTVAAAGGGAVPQRVSEPSLALALEVEGVGVSADRVKVRVLGAGQAREAPQMDAPRARASAPPPRRTITAQVTVPQLLPGENTIEASITDANHLNHVTRFTVTYTPERDARGALWLAIVAARDYTGLPPLPLTQRDAATVRAAFLRQQATTYREVHVRAFCDELCEPDGRDCRPCDARPTLTAIRRGVPEFFAGMQHGDTAVLYVSGHGTTDGRGGYYFLPEDARHAEAATGVAWTELRDFVTAPRKIGRKLVLLDTCSSGAATGASAREQDRIITQMAELEGVYVLTASASDASAFELNDLGNGVFTYALREALEGKADTSPTDAWIRFEELGRYVGERVREVARAHGMTQEPHVPTLDHAGLDFVVAAILKRALPLQLEVLQARPGKRDVVNPPDVRAKWEARLRALAGVELVDAAAMRFKLTL